MADEVIQHSRMLTTPDGGVGAGAVGAPPRGAGGGVVSDRGGGSSFSSGRSSSGKPMSGLAACTGSG